jgi:hypothetical protein
MFNNIPWDTIISIGIAFVGGFATAKNLYKK